MKRKSTHRVIAIDVEAINPLHLLAVGVMVTQHPGNQLIEKAKFVFPTHTYQGKTAEQFWSPENPETKTLQTEIQILPVSQQTILKRHAGFTLESLHFWIRHTETLRRLETEAKEKPQSLQDVHTFIKKHTCKGNKISFLTDNPAFDAGFLDCAFMQLGLESIRTAPCYHPVKCKDPHYLECKDVHGIAEGFLGRRHKSMSKIFHTLARKFGFVPITQPKTHDPLDDCSFIVCLYEALLTARQRSPESQPARTIFALPKNPAYTYFVGGCMYVQY